jgi:hypothetical protein
MTIEHREKIGLGTWDEDSRGSALNHVDGLGFDWHYNWSERPLWDVDTRPERSSFVAMLWDERDVTAEALQRVKDSGVTTLLGFNEPNHPGQANMTVDQALDLWPRLMATGLRLGSPAATQGGTLGEGSWLGRFMAGAEARGLRVDFVAVHYYSEDKDVGAFRAFLEAVHRQYGKPVWVTEWALADWDRPGRFSAAEQAAYARAAIEMMDDLAFVERHAWYSGYDGDEGLNAEVFRLDGALTPVGRAFRDLLDDTPDIVGTLRADVLVGGSAAEDLRGLNGADRLLAQGGDDLLDGGAGRDLVAGGGGDTVRGGGGDDSLSGSGGADALQAAGGRDRLDGGGGADRLWGGAGADLFVFAAGGDDDRILDFEDGVDRLALDDALWGGRAWTVSQVLARASVTEEGVLFDFGGGDRLRILGLDGIEALRDDLVVI